MSSTEVDSKKSESDYSASHHILEALLPPLSKCFRLFGWVETKFDI